jgi:hypothetical protein
MNAQQREYLRLALLRVLDANATRFGLGVTALASLVRVDGCQPTDGEAELELAYLEDKGLIVRLDKPISPENPVWRISALGRDLLAERGL